MITGANSEHGNRPSIYVAAFLLLTAIFAILLYLTLREPNKPDKVVQNGNGNSEQSQINRNGTGTSEQSKNEGDNNEGKDGGGTGGIGLVNVEEEGGATDVTATNALVLYIGPGLFDAPSTPGTTGKKPGKKPKSGPTGRQPKSEFEQRLAREGAQTGQIQISLAWNSYDDLDLHVLDPGNEVISFRNRRSRSGGTLDVDMNIRPESLQPVENIFWPENGAPRGKYKVKVHCFSYRGQGGQPVPFRVRMKIDGNLLPIWNGRVNPDGTVYVHDFTR